MYKKNLKGFSLVEILVSLAIFAVISLATISIVGKSYNYNKLQNESLISEQLVKQVVLTRLSNKPFIVVDPYNNTTSEILISDIDANGKNQSGFPGLNKGFYPSNLDLSLSTKTDVNSTDKDKRVLRVMDSKFRIYTYITPLSTTDRNVGYGTGGTTDGVTSAASINGNITYSIFKAVAHPVSIINGNIVVETKRVLSQSSCVIKRD